MMLQTKMAGMEHSVVKMTSFVANCGSRLYLAESIVVVAPAGKPSMRQDGEAHRRSEVELFAGTVLRRAEKHGLDVPVNRWLYETVKRMEAAY